MTPKNVSRVERAVVAVILALLVVGIVLAFPFRAWSAESQEISLSPALSPAPTPSPSPSPSPSPAVFSPDSPLPDPEWVDQWTGRDWEHEA